MTATIDPPYSGTIYLDGNIVKNTDPTTSLGITDAGRGLRWMYDRRIANTAQFNAYLFNAKFDDGLEAEVQVNPEFGSTEAAQEQAQKYAWLIGQLPTALRSRVRTVWIHKGAQPFGGGNDNLLIHTDQADIYQASGILEETLIHEASHTSLENHSSAADWLSAQEADGTFISTYARDNPLREDVAESFLCYIAVRHRADRIPAAMLETIQKTIPNRLTYFDNQHFNLHPIAHTMSSAAANLHERGIDKLPLNPSYQGTAQSPSTYE